MEQKNLLRRQNASQSTQLSCLTSNYGGFIQIGDVPSTISPISGATPNTTTKKLRNARNKPTNHRNTICDTTPANNCNPNHQYSFNFPLSSGFGSNTPSTPSPPPLSGDLSPAFPQNNLGLHSDMQNMDRIRRSISQYALLNSAKHASIHQRTQTMQPKLSQFTFSNQTNQSLNAYNNELSLSSVNSSLSTDGIHNVFHKMVFEELTNIKNEQKRARKNQETIIEIVQSIAKSPHKCQCNRENSGDENGIVIVNAYTPSGVRQLNEESESELSDSVCESDTVIVKTEEKSDKFLSGTEIEIMHNLFKSHISLASNKQSMSDTRLTNHSNSNSSFGHKQNLSDVFERNIDQFMQLLKSHERENKKLEKERVAFQIKCNELQHKIAQFNEANLMQKQSKSETKSTKSHNELLSPHHLPEEFLTNSPIYDSPKYSVANTILKSSKTGSDDSILLLSQAKPSQTENGGSESESDMEMEMEMEMEMAMANEDEKDGLGNIYITPNLNTNKKSNTNCSNTATFMDTRGLSYRYISSPAASMDLTRRSQSQSHHFYPPPQHKNNAYFAEVGLKQSKTSNVLGYVSQSKDEERLMDLSEIRYEDTHAYTNTQSMLDNILDDTPNSHAMSTPTTNTYVYHANAPRLVDIEDDPFGLAFANDDNESLIDTINNAEYKLQTLVANDSGDTLQSEENRLEIDRMPSGHSSGQRYSYQSSAHTLKTPMPHNLESLVFADSNNDSNAHTVTPEPSMHNHSNKLQRHRATMPNVYYLEQQTVSSPNPNAHTKNTSMDIQIHKTPKARRKRQKTRTNSPKKPVYRKSAMYESDITSYHSENYLQKSDSSGVMSDGKYNTINITMNARHSNTNNNNNRSCESMETLEGSVMSDSDTSQNYYANDESDLSSSANGAMPPHFPMQNIVNRLDGLSTDYLRGDSPTHLMHKKAKQKISIIREHKSGEQNQIKMKGRNPSLSKQSSKSRRKHGKRHSHKGSNHSSKKNEKRVIAKKFKKESF